MIRPFSWKHQNVTILQFVALVLLLTCPIALLHAETKTCGYISDAQKKKYQEATLENLRVNPDKYKKDSLKITIQYAGENEYVPYLYGKEMTQKRYFYYEIRNLEHCSDDRMLVLFSRTQRKKILDTLPSLKQGEPVALYGELKKLASMKKKDQLDENVSEYYFYVQDMETGIMDSIGKKPEDFDPKNYEEVDGKTLDLTASKYENKRVTFEMKYYGRDSEIDYRLRNMFPDDRFFQFENDVFYSSEGNTVNHAITAVCSKENQSVVDQIVNLKVRTFFRIYGTLKKYDSGDSRNFYYLIIDDIATAAKTKKETNPVAAEPDLPKLPEPLKKRKSVKDNE